eukprot:TRINITY_DN17736_c0_g1_i1.p1 TRINITY_DN17736_c0_g1~~TRINITY_DN17736_c0_g1_i1.p1  ORF type:complete len:167 (+),score=25.15 TRINITY_DN17736_c0_g1_i1:82-582(+)
MQAVPHNPSALNLVQRASRGMKSPAEVIGLGMSVVFILLLFAKLIWKKIRGTESTAVSEAQMTSDSETEREDSIKGLKPVAVASLPIMEFNKEAFCSRDDPHCSICLEEYRDKELLRTLPRCGHNFHHSCIDMWLQKQSTCPVCRLSLQDSFKAKQMVSPTFSTAV